MIPEPVRRANRAFRRDPRATADDALFADGQAVYVGSGSTDPQGFFRTGGIHHGSESPVVFRVIPVADPFEDIARHVVHAVVAGALRMRIHRQGRIMMPVIICLVGIEVVAPGIEVAVRAAGRLFPFGFGGQPLLAIFAVGFGIDPVDAHHRLLRLIQARIVPVGRRRMTGRLDEGAIVLVRHLVFVDEIGIQEHRMRRPFVVERFGRQRRLHPFVVQREPAAGICRLGLV